MPNQYLFQRLEGIQVILNGVHRSGTPMSAASKGDERAAFINNFLAKVLPTPNRFGTGDITDSEGNRTGQMDVVIEFPYAPCIPSAAGETRLYLAEGVAAVIEVKSDLSAQWNEVERTAASLGTISRALKGGVVFGPTPSERIPLFVVGYTGWAKIETVRQHLAETPSLAGILVVDHEIYVGRHLSANSAWSLWGLITELYYETSSLQVGTGGPDHYAEWGPP